MMLSSDSTAHNNYEFTITDYTLRSKFLTSDENAIFGSLAQPNSLGKHNLNLKNQL